MVISIHGPRIEFHMHDSRLARDGVPVHHSRMLCDEREFQFMALDNYEVRFQCMTTECRVMNRSFNAWLSVNKKLGFNG